MQYQVRQGLSWKFGFGPSTQISRGHKLAGSMGAAETSIGVQGQCPVVCVCVGGGGKPKTNLSISELKK